MKWAFARMEERFLDCVASSRTSGEKNARRRASLGMAGMGLEFCNLTETKIGDFHRGHDHFEGFLSSGADCRTQHLHV
jgi:hypothetical protein